jgi:hypothetical protein
VEYAQSATDAAAATTAPYVDPYSPGPDPYEQYTQSATDAAAANPYSPETDTYSPEPEIPSDMDVQQDFPTRRPTSDQWEGRGGGYLSSSGILAPYHKKLIDGLYAGGRINY